MIEEVSLTLRRDDGHHGPSLVERLATGLDRLRFGSPLHARRLKGRYPLKLLATPVDPVAGDRAAGERLRGGLLMHAGHAQRFADARFDAGPAAWRDWANGWGWLRDHTSAADPARDAARTRALAARWLARFPDWHRHAWRPDLTGRRLLMWLTHATWIFAAADHVHRSTSLNAMARWARHLDRAAPRLPPDMARLEAAAGLYAAGLLLPGGEARLAQAQALLAATCDALLRADGSTATRCPGDLAEMGDRLLLLTACHQARGQRPDAGLIKALDRIGAALGGLMMGDGAVDAWHGPAPTAAQLARLARPGGSPADASGFQRLVAGDAVLIADAAPPPPARVGQRAHASTLAIAFADSDARLLVNCGDGEGSTPELARGLRSTAAHCALVLDDTNSSRLHDGTARALTGVEQVTAQRRRTADGWHLDMRHDGYRRRFGLLHARRLFLAADGRDLRGEEALLPIGGRRAARAHRVAVRFHLGPGAAATLDADGLGARIRLGDAAWAFRAAFKTGIGRLTLEPSLWIGPDGASVAIQQLILTTQASNRRETAIGWSFRR